MYDFQQDAVLAIINKLEKYNGKYLAITGRLGTIDADLKYISIHPIETYRIIGVQCSLDDPILKEKEDLVLSA